MAGSRTSDRNSAGGLYKGRGTESIVTLTVMALSKARSGGDVHEELGAVRLWAGLGGLAVPGVAWRGVAGLCAAGRGAAWLCAEFCGAMFGAARWGLEHEKETGFWQPKRHEERKAKEEGNVARLQLHSLLWHTMT